jgi:predicted nuclease of predicted toxin-antitoxin system
VTSSNRPVFFIDWCLGKTVSYALSEASAQPEHHSNHFDQNAPDTEWLLVAGDRGWVVLTKDQAIGSNAVGVWTRRNVYLFNLKTCATVKFNPGNVGETIG